MKAEECVFFQLAKASQRASRFWGRKIDHLKVTPVQAMVLNFLSEEDFITSNNLGDRTGLDSATLTGIIDRLEAGGFLERRQNPHDRRAILVCLTEKGSCTGNEIARLVEGSNREFLSELTGKEEREFRILLKKARGNP